MRRFLVYTITLQGKVMYVGITKDFIKRKSAHKCGNGAIPTGTNLTDIEFRIIDEYDDRYEALKAEDKYITEYDTIINGWNTNRSGLIRSNQKEYNTKRYIEQKEHILTLNRIYKLEHKEAEKERRKIYRQNHKEKYAEYQRRYMAKKNNKLVN